MEKVNKQLNNYFIYYYLTKNNKMKAKIKIGVSFICLSFLFQQCAIIRPGEIGIKQTLGKIKGKPIVQGVKWYNPFSSRIVRINVRTVECFNTLPLPTKEGLSVNTEISLLYHVKPEAANDVYLKFGPN